MRTEANADARRARTIGFFAPYNAYGGTEQYLDTLIRPAIEMGHKAVFFHPADAPPHWVTGVGRWAETVAYSYSGENSDAGDGQGTHGGGGVSLRDIMRVLHRCLTPRSGRFALGFLRQVLHLRRIFERWPVDVLHAPDVSRGGQNRPVRGE